MIKINLKNLLFLLGLLLLITTTAQTATVSISNYYPSVYGEYEQLRLIPRVSDLTGACTIGNLYTNSNGILQYCRDNSGTGVWGPMADTWTQTADDIYLTDTAAAPNLRLGIGTTTPEFKLNLSGDGSILAKGTFGSGTILPSLGAGSRFIWYPRKSALRAGYVNGTQWDDANIGNYSVAMGLNTIASGLAAVILGGDTNIASGDYSLVAGGQSNTASNRAAVVLGGFTNTASGQWATISGGSTNTASGDYSAINGGHNNTASGVYTTIGGGGENISATPNSTVRGGYQNTIIQNDSSQYMIWDGDAGGGNANVVDPSPQGLLGYSVIAGGRQNNLEGDYSVIMGGYNNWSQDSYISILGGSNNATIAILRGGTIYHPDYTTILGGTNNTSNGAYAVLGGNGSGANSKYGVVLGGQSNAIGTYDSSGLALDNEGSILVGGTNNKLYYANSTIIGGSTNVIWGNYSWVGGYKMRLGSLATPANRSFLWGYDASASPPTITTSDAFMVATGRVGIRDLVPAALLEINANGTADHYLSIGKASKGNTFIIKKNANAAIKVNLGSGNASPTNAWDVATANNAFLTTGGVWTNASSRKTKDQITPLSSSESLTTLEKLQPVTFAYKISGNPGVGFIAEDAPELVAMNDHRSISAMDVIAVLMKEAQDQDQIIQLQDQKLQELTQRIQQLKDKLNDLKK